MKPDTLKKSVAYAYPTSPCAEKFGFPDTGCYFIHYCVYNLEGSGQISQPWADDKVGGFSSLTDPDLIASFAEAEGVVCNYSLMGDCQ